MKLKRNRIGDCLIFRTISTISYEYDIKEPDVRVNQKLTRLKSKLKFYHFSNTIIGCHYEYISFSLSKDGEIIFTGTFYSLKKENINCCYAYVLKPTKQTYEQIKDLASDFFVEKCDWNVVEATPNKIVFSSPNIKERPKIPKNVVCEDTYWGSSYDYTTSKAYREEHASRQGTFGVISNAGYPSSSTGKKKK